MPPIELTYRDDDGVAWFDGERIYVNLRWINIEEEVAWYIDESFIHEYIEHVLGLGHERAVFVEKVLRKLVYREWFGVCPTAILYGRSSGRGSSEKSK